MATADVSAPGSAKMLLSETDPGTKSDYKINRRPSYVKKLSRSGRYAAKKAEHAKSYVRSKGRACIRRRQKAAAVPKDAIPRD